MTVLLKEIKKESEPLTEQVLVQLLANKPNSYCWGVVNDSGQWQAPPHTGDKTALLSSLHSIALPIVLVIPGEKVVTNRVTYHPAEKRHFRQLLPYQLEEQVIGDVEDLHFATGPLKAGEVIVTYVDDTWFAETVAWYRDHGFTISRCIADFQLLMPAVNQWIIWSTESRIVCFHSSGLGFSAHYGLLKPLLADLLSGGQAKTVVDSDEVDLDPDKNLPTNPQGDANLQNDANTDIQLYADSEQALNYLLECLPGNVHGRATQCPGKPVLDLLGNKGIDFCQGPYASKLPFSHWWQASRTSVFLAVAALLAFIAVNLLEVFQLKDHQQVVKQQIEQRYRQVVPQGVMGDAVKQLQRTLGTTGTGVSQSQVMYLLSAVAPVVKAQKIDITTLAYNDNNRELRLNIEAKAFNVIEKLRKQLQVDGLQSQLKRSDSSNNTVRARLHISIAEG